MKKLAVAVTLAVLFGGVSSVFAQSMTGTSQSNTVNQNQIKQQAFLNKLLTKGTQTNMSYERVFRTEGGYTMYSPSAFAPIFVGNGQVSYSFKPYPLQEGDTFPGYVYRDVKASKNYVVVSDKVWEAIENNCKGVGVRNEEKVIGADGKVLFRGKPTVSTYQTDDKKTTYKVIAFPFPEESKK